METLPEAPRDEPERAPTNDGKLPPASEDTDTNLVFDFDDSVFSPAGPSRQTLTRAEKRENRRRYRHANVGDVSPEELRRLQDADESLSRPRSIADTPPLEKSSSAETGYSTAGIAHPAQTVVLTTLSSLFYRLNSDPLC